MFVSRCNYSTTGEQPVPKRKTNNWQRTISIKEENGFRRRKQANVQCMIIAEQFEMISPKEQYDIHRTVRDDQSEGEKSGVVRLRVPVQTKKNKPLRAREGKRVWCSHTSSPCNVRVCAGC
jgi:hypothetical protein